MRLTTAQTASQFGFSFQTAILATSLAATVAVGIASASIDLGDQRKPAAKTDRLPVVAEANGYVTIETCTDGLSVLKRIPIS